MSQVFQPSFYKRTTHEPSRTMYALSSLFRVGKILIYVKTDYHKLHMENENHDGCFQIVLTVRNKTNDSAVPRDSKVKYKIIFTNEYMKDQKFELRR